MPWSVALCVLFGPSWPVKEWKEWKETETSIYQALVRLLAPRQGSQLICVWLFVLFFVCVVA